MSKLLEFQENIKALKAQISREGEELISDHFKPFLLDNPDVRVDFGTYKGGFGMMDLWVNPIDAEVFGECGSGRYIDEKFNVKFCWSLMECEPECPEAIEFAERLAELQDQANLSGLELQTVLS